MRCYVRARQSNCHYRGLCDHTYYTKTKPGFGDDVNQQLMEAAQIHTCSEEDKYVALIMDEMHSGKISNNFVMSRDSFTGFCMHFNI